MKQTGKTARYNPTNRITKWMIRILIAVFTLLFIALFMNRPVENGGVWKPDYQKIDLESIVKKAELTEEDYHTILMQTGLGREAADELLRSLPEKNRERKFEQYQSRFFSSVDYECRPAAIFVREERIRDEEGNPVKAFDIPNLKDGDILITKATHTIGWRHGHAGIVTNAAEGETLESILVGTPSVIQNISKWQTYPSFILLRLKGDKEAEAGQIAQYAREKFRDIPYGLLTGIPDKAPADLKKTQCSHLVWYPYAQFGYDIDSDGSWLVTPKDITNSEYLEVVQVYGVDPEEIWP